MGGGGGGPGGGWQAMCGAPGEWRRWRAVGPWALALRLYLLSLFGAWAGEDVDVDVQREEIVQYVDSIATYRVVYIDGLPSMYVN